MQGHTKESNTIWKRKTHNPRADRGDISLRFAFFGEGGGSFPFVCKVLAISDVLLHECFVVQFRLTDRRATVQNVIID